MTNNNLCYEFGPYQLDPSKRLLTRAGDSIILAPKATEILIVLVRYAGQLVEKDVLLKEVWPDTFVEEANLSQNVFTLRRVLGDGRAEPKYIETVARRGYRFTAPVRMVPQAVSGLPAQAAGVPGQSPVVAVLPFLNNTGDPELEYLADGITSNVINNLSRITQLRVMSRSTVFRYKETEVDLQHVGRELRVDVVLVGKIKVWKSELAATLELVNAITGWQLWGATLDFESSDLLQLENTITRHVVAALQLQLSGDQEKHVTARYTENADAYDAYIEGRYHWSRYTRKGIEKAIRHFRHAIKIDPNYALAYAAIVDCYLRLATNYLPAEDSFRDPLLKVVQPEGGESLHDSDSKVRLRFEWDWKGAERELRRANELKTNYPAAHQWYAAYKMAKQIYDESCVSKRRQNKPETTFRRRRSSRMMPNQIACFDLTPSEQVQVNCTVARDQIDLGNHEAACKILGARWTFGDWPRLDGLNQQSCADLLFTAGELASYVANTTQIAEGQKHAEQLLNGSIALFEQLGLRKRAAEGRIELALCYYRQGSFDIGRYTLTRVLDQLSEESTELRGLALIRLATVERHSGRLKDALAKLQEAIPIVEVTGPWTTARCFLELASTYKDLAVAETVSSYSEQAKDFYLKALTEFEAIGHHRYVAVVENNLGFLLLGAGLYKESEEYLIRSLRSFVSFSDSVAAAQVNETLARLYIETKRYTLAQEVVERAVKILERTDHEALLAEAVTTSGLVAAKQLRLSDAKKSFEAAYNIAERCGDSEGAGRALLMMLEELSDSFAPAEKEELLSELTRLLATTQQRTLQARVETLIETIRSSQL